MRGAQWGCSVSSWPVSSTGSNEQILRKGGDLSTCLQAPSDPEDKTGLVGDKDGSRGTQEKEVHVLGWWDSAQDLQGRDRRSCLPGDVFWKQGQQILLTDWKWV